MDLGPGLGVSVQQTVHQPPEAEVHPVLAAVAVQMIGTAGTAADPHRSQSVGGVVAPPTDLPVPIPIIQQDTCILIDFISMVSYS